MGIILWIKGSTSQDSVESFLKIQSNLFLRRGQNLRIQSDNDLLPELKKINRVKLRGGGLLDNDNCREVFSSKYSKV